MKGLTTIAALPGSGAGCAAALRAETVPKAREEKPAAGPFDLMMRDITKIVIQAAVSDFMKTFEAQAIVQKLKEPATRKVFTETCRAKFTGRPLEPVQTVVLASDFCDPNKAAWSEHYAGELKADADFLDITSVPSTKKKED